MDPPGPEMIWGLSQATCSGRRGRQAAPRPRGGSSVSRSLDPGAPVAPAAEHLGILLRCRAWSGLRGHDSASPTHSWAWPAAERPDGAAQGPPPRRGLASARLESGLGWPLQARSQVRRGSRSAGRCQLPSSSLRGCVSFCSCLPSHAWGVLSLELASRPSEGRENAPKLVSRRHVKEVPARSGLGSRKKRRLGAQLLESV